MNKLRLVAATTAAAASVLLVAPQMMPASASQPGSSPAAASAVERKPLIQGVVVDQFGHEVDGVTVQATKADGTAAASAITYASDRADGPQHGYFFLEVSKGSFTLTISKSGYRTAKVGPVEVERRFQHVSLGEVQLDKDLTATRTGGAPDDATITTKQHGVVLVEVTAKGKVHPTGAVEIREGRTVVGEDALRRTDKGSVEVDLDKLAKGKHELKAYYLGSSSFEGSTSKAFTLTVSKPKH
jgi:hypothetical protein